ncbi:hypothetical protein [Streptomyces sp. H39-S7]|uniref:hypothetical protein n=1 Tax=Streptomyces sp. H39-S7 TaxID=3004357 RepID=UPI0022AEF0C4|nr:hypothetical protein [Streptomyces sp. H39-S7]MCZ4120102.1 hypothetical protein [Streptomyces sp. H39-S7]
MTTPHGSAQAALLARIVASGLVNEPTMERDTAEAEAEAAAEGLSDCVERPASGGAGDAGPEAADDAARAEAEAENVSDCVESLASGGVGGAAPEAADDAATAEAEAGHPASRRAADPDAAESVVPGPVLLPGGDTEPLDGAATDEIAVVDRPARDVGGPADVALQAAGAGEAGAGHPAARRVAGSAGSDTRLAATAARRRGPADPVRSMMHRHEELCAGAVDVLEIAAGLEAHGVTDRVAGRFRHRDVFSLADELYGRVPHSTAGGRAVPGRVGPVRVGVLHVVPGAGCAAAAAFVVRSPAVGAVVALLVALATWAALRRGPLRTGNAGGAPAAGWLLAFALCGGPLLAGLLDAPFDPPATAPFVALVLTRAPAAWCAHRFALRARAELTPSRGLGEFAARVRPLLAGTLALYLVVLCAFLWAAAALAGPAGVAGAGALGALLFTARLLAVHGFTRAAAWGTGVAAAAEAAALGAAALHHVPGLAALSAPVERVGPAAIPVLACGCAAAVLVAHAFRVLTRASAHATATRTGPPARPRPTDLRNPNQEQR